MIIYDIESFPNVFLLSYKRVEEKTRTTFEISWRKNELSKIVKFWKDCQYEEIISFNGLEYDNIIWNYVVAMSSQFEGRKGQDIAATIAAVSDYIIKNDTWNDKTIKKLRFLHNWTDLDLFKYWSKLLRISKKISLKGLGIQLNYPVVQDLPFEPGYPIPENNFDMERLIHYNAVHDLEILELLYLAPVRLQGKPTTMREQANMRRDAIIRYGFGKETMSWDGVKLGLNILLHEYCESTKQNIRSVRAKRGVFEPVALNEIIEKKVSFKETPYECRAEGQDIVCNSFYSVWRHMQTVTVVDTKTLSYRVIKNGVRYDIKSGGLHSYHNSECIEPEGMIYRDADVGSYYPTLGAKYGYTPRHLPGFDVFLDKLRLRRLEAKHAGRKAEDRLYKLALNGGYYGNLNNEHTAMYDPIQLLSVTVNGQLFLLMLCEWFIERCPKSYIDSCNTDGVTFVLDPSEEDIFKKMCSEWEELTDMELEYEDFIKIARSNINNYIGITVDGSTKKKGWFLTEPDLGNKVNHLVVPKALEAYFKHGTPPEEFILNHGNIFDFCISQKVDRSFKVKYRGEILPQRINRYYVSKEGAYLYKTKNGSESHMLKGWGVNLFNVYEEGPYSIDYRFYISKAREIISDIEFSSKSTKSKQKSLW